MGLGPTWPVMSLIHLFWVDDAASRLGTTSARRAAWFNTAIGGDDLLGAWPDALADSYANVVKECGGKFSPGKTYRSKSAGNFTEMTFTATPGRRRIRWEGGIPLKGLIGLSADKAGESVEAFGFDEGRRLRARRVLRALRPGVWRQLRSAGVAAVWPRALGGGGLPPVRGSTSRVSAPKPIRLAVGKYLYGSSDHRPFRPPTWVEARDPVSLAARREAETRATADVESGALRRTTDPTDRREEDVLASLAAFFTEGFLFSERDLPAARSEIAPPSRFARSVRAWVKKATRGGLPDRLAVREGASSRASLLKRSRIVKDRRRLAPTEKAVYCLPDWAVAVHAPSQFVRTFTAQ